MSGEQKTRAVRASICTGITLRGVQCTKMTKNPSGYCNIHDKAEKKDENDGKREKKIEKKGDKSTPTKINPELNIMLNMLRKEQTGLKATNINLRHELLENDNKYHLLLSAQNSNMLISGIIGRTTEYKTFMNALSAQISALDVLYEAKQQEQMVVAIKIAALRKILAKGGVKKLDNRKITIGKYTASYNEKFECCICLEESPKGVLLMCGHKMHGACIGNMILMGMDNCTACPTCRKPMV